MKTVKLNDNQWNNLIAFLDRVEIKGLKEVQAINEVLTALQNADEEN